MNAQTQQNLEARGYLTHEEMALYPRNASEWDDPFPMWQWDEEDGEGL